MRSVLLLNEVIFFAESCKRLCGDEECIRRCAAWKLCNRVVSSFFKIIYNNSNQSLIGPLTNELMTSLIFSCIAGGE